MRKGGLRIFGLAIVLQLTAAQFAYEEETACSTPKNVPGECVNLKKCTSLMRLLQQKPLKESTRRYLLQSQCGFDGSDPTVCCPLDDEENDTGAPNVTNHPNQRLLDHENCGPINRDKIKGGHWAGLLEFPWMALLAYRTGAPIPQFRCGGTVINKRYILTAAHCVTSLPSNLQLVGVRVGEHDTSKERDCEMSGNFEEYCAEKYQDFGIESIHYHPQYSPVKYQNDIALLRVNRDIDFRPANAKPICLPIGSAAEIKSTKLVVTGWGVFEEQRASPVMLKVTLPVFSHNECVKTYERKIPIWHKQICMGGQQGKDSCSGDSGGPLQAPAVYINGMPRFVQYGVVSFGLKNCGTEGFPGVYTRVDYYMDWILDNMRD